MIKPLVENIVVAVNGSVESMKAAMYGILMCRLYHCKMKAVFVVDTQTIGALQSFKFLMTSEGRDIEQKLCEDGQKYLNHVELLGKSKGVKVATVLKKGCVWEGIVESAEEVKAQLILIGGATTGYSTNDGLLHNDSITKSNREIINGALCSVLIVRSSHIEQIFKSA